MVTRCGIILLVRLVMFFVYDNQPQLIKGQEHGRPRTQDDVVFVPIFRKPVAQQMIPHFSPFVFAVARMVHAYPVAKILP